MLRSLACTSLLLALAAGCAAGASSSSASSDIAADGPTAAKTVVKGSIAVGATISLGYEPGEYAVNGLPYLAVTFEPTDASVAIDGTRTIKVGGDFPSTPHLLVVDPSFKVLAEADGTHLDGGAEAKVSFPASTFAARNMLLVQDPRWNAPMSFDVTAE